MIARGRKRGSTITREGQARSYTSRRQRTGIKHQLPCLPTSISPSGTKAETTTRTRTTTDRLSWQIRICFIRGRSRGSTRVKENSPRQYISASRCPEAGTAGGPSRSFEKRITDVDQCREIRLAPRSRYLVISKFTQLSL